jgi:coenzyme F420-0:L-glutamate ligase / coenzyme F420-1:gamma-L-glutamate ligase
MLEFVLQVLINRFMLTISPLINFPLIVKDDNIAELILLSLTHNEIALQDGDILVIAQKIVSKAEGRYVSLNTVDPSKKAEELAIICEKDPRLVDLILRESNHVIRIKPGTIIVEHRLGFICANAGIDHSNVVTDNITDEYVLLLPENPDKSAGTIRQYIQLKNNIKIGIMIIDSHGRAWRLGVVGTTIGLSGLPGLVDMRGKPDLFGGILRTTQIGAADELAGVASLVMGQANEGIPVVHVRGFPYNLRESNLKELIRPVDQDLFR